MIGEFYVSVAISSVINLSIVGVISEFFIAFTIVVNDSMDGICSN